MLDRLRRFIDASVCCALGKIGLAAKGAVAALRKAWDARAAAACGHVPNSR